MYLSSPPTPTHHHHPSSSRLSFLFFSFLFSLFFFFFFFFFFSFPLLPSFLVFFFRNIDKPTADTYRYMYIGMACCCCLGRNGKKKIFKIMERDRTPTYLPTYLPTYRTLLTHSMEYTVYIRIIICNVGRVSTW